MSRAEASTSRARFLCGGVQRMPRRDHAGGTIPIAWIRLASRVREPRKALLNCASVDRRRADTQSSDRSARLGSKRSALHRPVGFGRRGGCAFEPESCPPSRALAAPGRRTLRVQLAAALANLDELRRDVRPSAPYRATGATGHRLRPGVGGQPRSVVRLSAMGRAIVAADSQPQDANIGRCGPRVRGPGLQVVCLATARDVPFVRRTASARPSARRAAGRGW